MAKFELNIYGENDEILKRYETDFVRYGVFMEAVKLQERFEKLSVMQQIEASNALVKKVFAGITDEELMLADTSDVLNTITQISAQVQNIDGSKN